MSEQKPHKRHPRSSATNRSDKGRGGQRPTYTTKRRRRKTSARRRLLVWGVVLMLAVIVLAAVVLLLNGNLFGRPADGPPTDNQPAVTTVETAASTVPSAEPTASTPSITAVSNSKTTSETSTKTTVNTPQPSGHYVQTGDVPWNLRLVNQWNRLPDTFFKSVPLERYATAKEFDKRAIQSLRDLVQAGEQHDVWAASLYRDLALQTKNYNREVQKQLDKGYSQAKAEQLAASVVARPGTSEHHTGLAVDILGSGYYSLVQSFGTSDAGKWLRDNCADYGFILRYPKEKESITGVVYEPWHFRYVGKEHAQEIMRRGITLEEYLEEKGW